VVLNDKAKILIRNLYLFKNYSARKFIRKFPEKDWKLRTLNYFWKKLRESGSTGRKPESGRRSLTMRLTSGVLG